MRLIPESVGAAVGSLGSGLIMNATGRYRLLNVGVELLMVLPAGLIALTFDAHTSTWPPFLFFFLSGAGYGGILTVTLLALISAVDAKHHAVITSASYAFRSTGGVIGITLASSIFQNLLKSQLWKRFGGRDDAADAINRLGDSLEEIQHLPPTWKEEALGAYMEALRGVWLLILGLAALGAIISLLMREHVPTYEPGQKVIDMTFHSSLILPKRDALKVQKLRRWTLPRHTMRTNSASFKIKMLKKFKTLDKTSALQNLWK